MMANVIVTWASAVGDFHHTTCCSSPVTIENGIPMLLDIIKKRSSETPVDKIKRFFNAPNRITHNSLDEFNCPFHEVLKAFWHPFFQSSY